MIKSHQQYIAVSLLSNSPYTILLKQTALTSKFFYNFTFNPFDNPVPLILSSLARGFLEFHGR